MLSPGFVDGQTRRSYFIYLRSLSDCDKAKKSTRLRASRVGPSAATTTNTATTGGATAATTTRVSGGRGGH